MFGFVGNYAGNTAGQLKGIVDRAKFVVGMRNSFYDHAAYDFGWNLKQRLTGQFNPKTRSVNLQVFCRAFELTARQNPYGLQEEARGGGYHDYNISCKDCPSKIKTRIGAVHGGFQHMTTIF